MVLGAFIEFRLFIKDIFFEMGKCKNSVKFLFVKAVVFIVFNSFVIIEEVYWRFNECLAQILDYEHLDILILKIAIGWIDLQFQILQKVFFVETLPHLFEDFVLKLIADLAES